MKLLLILLSFMTLTVENNHTVSLTGGQWPYDIEVNYSNSYNKGQVRAGDTATLTLSNLGSITVDTIRMAMRSNASAGKGTVTVYAGSEQLVSKNITRQTVSEAVKIYIGPKAGVDSLTIRTVGTENSLYIDSYTIAYGTAAPSTVTLMNGAEQYAVLTGTTVQLPSMPTIEEWRFVGWTAQAFETTSTMPELLNAGAYRPTSDLTLWAVYEYIPSLDQSIITTLQDGVYVYANWSSQWAMSGNVQNGVAGASALNLEDACQWYQITFDADGLATIQLIYVYGTEYIGFSGTKLAHTLSKWQVYHDGQKTLFYTEVKGQNYVLFPGKLSSDLSTYDTELMYANDLSNAPTVLLSTEPVLSEPLYTCYPENPMGIETVEQSEVHGERVVRFGIYELVIKGNHKYLRIR